MRRSALRARVSEIVASMRVDERFTHGVVGTRLEHTPGLDLAKPGAAAKHLSFVVTLGKTVPLGRGNDLTAFKTPISVAVAFSLRATLKADGKWADIDLADDLAEDIAAVLLADDDLGLDPLAFDSGTAADSDTDGRILLEFSVAHRLGPLGG